MRILVLSTTGHPEANLESARYFIENKTNINKITILSTDLMTKEGKTALLQQSIQQICDIQIEILEIQYGAEENNMLAIKELIITWANTHAPKDRFLFNVTGGTKLMSIALDKASILLGTSRAECFYQSRDNSLVWYQRQREKIVYPMNSNLNLQQRVVSRGYQITNQYPITDISIEQLKYSQILVEAMKNDFKKGRSFCSFINLLAAMSDEQEKLSLCFNTMKKEQVESLNILAQTTNQHFFEFDTNSKTISFKSKDAREFMKGGWLEVYTGYECFKAIMSLNPQAELAINVTLKKNDTSNEMDVMFIHHAHLYCIECKTAITMASENAKDVLYKLSALHDFGGLNQKRAVVSLYNLKDYNLTRAENAGIKVFQEKKLLNLSEHILKWLQPECSQRDPIISL
ncbi:Card1-like endonuclease domain-containing protein [Acinetobacter guillouiae]|uniref:Card1-like endonuclease domain-containing protein n=1 Tax=Acinetobacter guillouiae TaxID=106649 RepID=UPI003AF78CB8